MINVNERTYDTIAIIRPIILPHECRCLFLLDKIKMCFVLLQKEKYILINCSMHSWTISERRWMREQTRRHD
jgi:hypothetical protein